MEFSPRSSIVCRSCSMDVDPKAIPKFVRATTGVYHAHCFYCGTGGGHPISCRSQLSLWNYDAYEGIPYCRNCVGKIQKTKKDMSGKYRAPPVHIPVTFSERKLQLSPRNDKLQTLGGSSKVPSCPACKKAVYKLEEVKIQNSSWHRMCLSCGGTGDNGCKRALSAVAYEINGGNPYCKTCYAKVTAVPRSEITTTPTPQMRPNSRKISLSTTPLNGPPPSDHHNIDDIEGAYYRKVLKGSGIKALRSQKDSSSISIPKLDIKESSNAPTAISSITTSDGKMYVAVDDLLADLMENAFHPPDSPSSKEKLKKFRNSFNEPACPLCHFPIMKQDEILVYNIPWHRHCFTCNVCTKRLTEEEYEDHNALPFCKSCVNIRSPQFIKLTSNTTFTSPNGRRPSNNTPSKFASENPLRGGYTPNTTTTGTDMYKSRTSVPIATSSSIGTTSSKDEYKDNVTIISATTSNNSTTTTSYMGPIFGTIPSNNTSSNMSTNNNSNIGNSYMHPKREISMSRESSLRESYRSEPVRADSFRGDPSRISGDSFRDSTTTTIIRDGMNIRDSQSSHRSTTSSRATSPRYSKMYNNGPTTTSSSMMYKYDNDDYSQSSLMSPNNVSSPNSPHSNYPTNIFSPNINNKYKGVRPPSMANIPVIIAPTNGTIPSSSSTSTSINNSITMSTAAITSTSLFSNSSIPSGVPAHTNVQFTEPSPHPYSVKRGTLDVLFPNESTEFDYSMGNIVHEIEQEHQEHQEYEQTLYLNDLTMYTDILYEKKLFRAFHFTYRSDFDERGILYWIGTQGRNHIYRNPHTAGYLIASMSSCHIGYPFNLVSRTIEHGPNYTENIDKSWIEIDFGPRRLILPDHYTLRHGGMSKGNALRNWILQGKMDPNESKSNTNNTNGNTGDSSNISNSNNNSNNSISKSTSQKNLSSLFSSMEENLVTTNTSTTPSGVSPLPKKSDSGANLIKLVDTNGSKNELNATNTTKGIQQEDDGWITLRTHENDEFLDDEPGASASFSIDIPHQHIDDFHSLGFRYIRLKMTGLNSSQNNCLFCCGLEFYGLLFERILYIDPENKTM